jgi:glycosyltransferase involved in cell wall biosynthesis
LHAFGQVYREAMACGLPVVATPTGGPLFFVNSVRGRPNGWLVNPDDEAALPATLAYAWDTIATLVASLYEGMLATMGTSQAT